MKISARVAKAREEFDQIYRSFKEGNATLDDLKAIVNKVEELQKDYDIESSFTEAQKLVHDLLIEIETENIGKIENRKALNLVGNIQEICRYSSTQ